MLGEVDVDLRIREGEVIQEVPWWAIELVGTLRGSSRAQEAAKIVRYERH
jgi:hypothetical protein